MEIIYRANDGTEFTNEQDCISYENGMNCLCDKKNFIAFNSNLEPYNMTSDEIESTLEMMEYFVCLTDEAVVALNSMFDYIGCCAPTGGIKVLTYYGWGIENPDQWDAFPDVYNAFNERFEKLMRIENTLYESVKQARGE